MRARARLGAPPGLRVGEAGGKGACSAAGPVAPEYLGRLVIVAP